MSEFSNFKDHPHHQHSHMSSSSMRSSNCCTNDGETLCCYHSRCGHFFNQYRGPLIVIAIGIGFMAVGAIPVSIAVATKAKNSALIIGAGFIGFGLIIFLPGLIWCVVQRVLDCACCTEHCQCCTTQQQFPLQDDDDDEETSRIEDTNNCIVAGLDNHNKSPPSYKYIPQHTLLNNVNHHGHPGNNEHHGSLGNQEHHGNQDHASGQDYVVTGAMENHTETSLVLNHDDNSAIV